MRSCSLLFFLLFCNSVFADWDAGVSRLIFPHHVAEVESLETASELNPIGRFYAHEVVTVKTPLGLSNIVRVIKPGGVSKTYLVDELEVFSLNLLDKVYIVPSEEIQPRDSVILSPSFAAVCIASTELDGKINKVNCHRSYEVKESSGGVTVRVYRKATHYDNDSLGLTAMRLDVINKNT